MGDHEQRSESILVVLRVRVNYDSHTPSSSDSLLLTCVLETGCVVCADVVGFMMGAGGVRPRVMMTYTSSETR